MKDGDYHRAYDEEAAKIAMPIKAGPGWILAPIFVLAVAAGMLIGRLFG